MYKILIIFCYFLLTSTDPADLLRLTLAGILSLMITWFIIVATSVGMAVFLGALGRELSYYTHTLNIVWLFVLPPVTAAISFHVVLQKYVFKVSLLGFKARCLRNYPVVTVVF